MLASGDEKLKLTTGLPIAGDASRSVRGGRSQRHSMSFSVAVWSSLALCGFDLVKHHLPRYRRSRAALPAPRRQPVPVRVSAGRGY